MGARFHTCATSSACSSRYCNRSTRNHTLTCTATPLTHTSPTPHLRHQLRLQLQVLAAGGVEALGRTAQRLVGELGAVLARLDHVVPVRHVAGSTRVSFQRMVASTHERGTRHTPARPAQPLQPRRSHSSLCVELAAHVLLLLVSDAQAARARVGGPVPLQLDGLVQQQAQVGGGGLGGEQPGGGVVRLPGAQGGRSNVLPRDIGLQLAAQGSRSAHARCRMWG